MTYEYHIHEKQGRQVFPKIFPKVIDIKYLSAHTNAFFGNGNAAGVAAAILLIAAQGRLFLRPDFSARNRTGIHTIR